MTHLWTSGFFNERFPDPVSPLGWSVIQALVEQTAFQEPLRFVGYRVPDDLPLTRLYHGRPYANVRVFQMLYRLFPAALVSEDAQRLFPKGDVSLRLGVGRPPLYRIACAVLRTVLTERGWHPWNYCVWQCFVPAYERAIARARKVIAHADDLPTLLRVVDTLMALSRDLLRLHRWSLTYAEVCYTLLRRLLRAWFGPEEAAKLGAVLVSGLPNKSTEADMALWALAERATTLPRAAWTRLEQGDYEGLLRVLGESPQGARFQAALQRFLAAYGHRSPSLDVRYPSYRDAPAQVLAVIAHFVRHPEENPIQREFAAWRRRAAATQRLRRRLREHWPERVLPLWWLLRMLLQFTQQYMRLREDQRFAWQESLAAKRAAFLNIGRQLAAQNVLSAPEDVFFLTLDELRRYVHGSVSANLLRERALARRREVREWQGASYPAFLQGDAPMTEEAENRGREFRGIGVSPGVAVGPARVAPGPQSLPRLSRELTGTEILVTVSTDPGWTPLFLRLRGLVMERGGQLSHGAVVAREYGLPAVAGIPGVVARIRDGQRLMVDGNRGVVTVLEGDVGG